MTPVSTIDWEKARARLRASEKALEEALNTSAERVQAVFRQRASRLAQPRGADKGTSKTVALLVFRLASERYGVALTELAEVLPYKGCTRVPGSAPQFPGVISLRGELRPVLDLGLALTGNRGSETGFVLIPRRGHVGLKVDEVDGMREIRSEELSPPGQSRYIRGLAPGALMVLDTDALLSTVSSPKGEFKTVMNMKIGTRILAGYTLALLALGAVGLITYRAIGELVESADWVAHTHKVKETLAVTVGSLRDAETGQRGFLITGDERYLEPYLTGIRNIDNGLRSLTELTTDNPNQQRRLEALRPLVVNRLAVLAQLVEARRKEGRLSTVDMSGFSRGQDLMDKIRQIIAEMDREESDLLLQRDRQAKSTARFASLSMIFGGLALAIVVIVAGVLTQRSITRPLGEFMQFAGRVGAGDLTQESRISTADELGDLGRRLDQMVAGLREVAGQTRSATVNLTSASAEILASTQQQAASTAEQAAAVQQTTVTMEEVTQSGAQIAERAKQVAASAEAAATASHAGLQAMDRTNRTMESIREQAESVAENVVALSEKTQAIGEIIATVNDLAEQSHLLALNAAIEAAAAGEHGRSFSVIASEVKNLADQSREATLQVRGILGDIQKGINTSVMRTEEAVKRVESGKQQAEVAGQTIRTMADSIQQSVQAFQQIVAGSNQQALGFAQVMQAIRDIGQASQQSAASTQQLEKAALALSTLSQQLQKTVERYRI